MQTSGSVNKHHVGTIGLGTAQCVECNRCRVASHLLLDDCHSYPLAPNTKLFHCSGTERIGSSKIYLLASLFELICQFAYGGSLAHSIHSHHEYHVWLMVRGQFPIFVVIGIVLRQQCCYLLPEDAIEFRCAHILVASHAFLNATNNLQCCIHSHVTRDEHFLKIIEHIVVHLRLSCHCTRQFVENACLCFFQTLVKSFLLILIKKTEYSHNCTI